MSKEKQSTSPKSERKKVSFDLKLSVIDQINNGQISINHAAKVSGISRSTIAYWKRKLSTFEQTNKTMSKNDEIKKLKERIEELEFVKEVQQYIIADLEHVTGEHLSKKSLPEALAKQIEKKRLDLSK